MAGGVEQARLRALAAAAGWAAAECPGDGAVRVVVQTRSGRTLYQPAGDAPAPRPAAEGPVRPGVFVWRGKEVHLPPRQWAAAALLWECGRVTVAELCDHVWGGPVCRGTVKSALSRLNVPLAEAGCPLAAELSGGRVAFGGMAEEVA